MRIVTSEGRLIDYSGGQLKSLLNPPVTPPPPKRRNVNKLSANPDPKRMGDYNPHAQDMMNLPGYRDWWIMRASASRKLDGEFDPKVVRSRSKAEKQAVKDLENIKQTLVLSEVAEEALKETLVVLRDKSTPKKERLAAAKQLLDFTMAKPVAKSEVTVNTAEDWLKSIG